MSEGPGQVRCEVCEAVQAPASSCAACGMPLRVSRRGPPVAAPVERLADMEPTVADRVDEVPGGVMPGFEPTTQERAPELDSEPMPGFEMTADMLIDLPGEDDVLEGIERTAEDFERTPEPIMTPLACPWCGYEQNEGRICDHCGRSRLRILPPEKRLEAIANDERTRVRCRACGSVVTHARLCSDCGQPMPSLD